MRLLRKALFKGLPLPLLLIAFLPHPREQAWKAMLCQRGCDDKTHEYLTQAST